MNPDYPARPQAGPAAPHPARLAVGVIGAGRAGTALGTALARAGHAHHVPFGINLRLRTRGLSARVGQRAPEVRQGSGSLPYGYPGQRSIVRYL